MTGPSLMAKIRLVALAFVFALLATACSSSTAEVTEVVDAAEDTAAVASEPTVASTSVPDPTAVPEAASDDSATDNSTAEDSTAVEDSAAADEAMGEDEPEEADDAPTSSAPAFGSDDDFCRVARELDENDPFEDADLDPFSPDFFDAAAELYDGLLAIAPDEIRGDIELVRNELGRIAEELAAIDYDFTNPKFGEVMESLEGGTVEDAGVRIEAYLRDVCGIDVAAVDEVEVDDIPSLGLDDEALAGLADIGPEEAAMLLAGLNLDPELQQCLFEKLPELTASQDPAILTQEICGTTLLEIVSGLSG